MALPRTNREKHWVCYVGDESHMKKLAEIWVGTKRVLGEDYEMIGVKTPLFANIKDNDNLIIYCHGSPENTSLWLKDYVGYANQDKDNRSKLEEKEYTPQDFLAFLNSQQLNADHKKLTLAACYSDEFAKELFEICKDDFPNLDIIGYKDQLVIGQGRNAGILAGLNPPVIYQEKNNWRIDDKVFAENENNLIIYAAENQCKIFKASDRLEKKSEQIPTNTLETDVHLSSPSNTARPYTRQSARNSQTLSRGSLTTRDELDIPQIEAANVPAANLTQHRRHSTSSIFSSLNLDRNQLASNLTNSASSTESKISSDNDAKIASSNPMSNNQISQKFR